MAQNESEIRYLTPPTAVKRARHLALLPYVTDLMK